jgi:hypothetical protein
MATRAQALCGGLIHDLVRSADIVWRLGGVAPGRVTGLVEIDFEQAGKHYLERERGKQ